VSVHKKRHRVKNFNVASWWRYDCAKIVHFRFCSWKLRTIWRNTFIMQLRKVMC